MVISPGDKFLGVLTSTRELPIEGSNGVFSVIDATIKGGGFSEENSWNYWNWLFGMEELGFLFVNMDKKKVLVEAQFLCRSVAKQDEVYLCGARTPDFIKTVEAISRNNGLSFRAEHCLHSFPNRICIRGAETNFQALAEQANLPLSGVPSSYIEALREICLSDLVGSRKLQETLITDLSFLCIGSVIDGLSQCFMTTDITQQDDDELRFFSPLSLKYDGKPPSLECSYALGQRIHYGRHDNLYRIAGDGSIQVCSNIARRHAKYYCLSRAGVKLGYNRLRKAVLVPKYCRLPLNLARALAFCQCMPPREITLSKEYIETLGFSKGSNPFLEYKGVPEVITKLLETRLNMTFHTINYKEDRLLCKTQ